MTQPSGAQWVERFPGSNSLADLVSPFRESSEAFVSALRDAGASVTINATYRPPERAYLMHFSCLVAGYQDAQHVHHQLPPDQVPPMQGVEIDWTCGGDQQQAITAAAAMVAGYRIAFPAALVSNHTRRKALDMTVLWKGAIHVRNKAGIYKAAACQSDLWPIGASYGVLKLPSDEPHWSQDGH